MKMHENNIERYLFSQQMINYAIHNFLKTDTIRSFELVLIVGKTTFFQFA